MDLVLLKAFAGGKLDHDRTPLVLGVEDLRLAGFNVERSKCPRCASFLLCSRSSGGAAQLYPHRHMVIAIDGPAGAGKSTVARGVAARARVHLPRFRGDVPLRRSRGPARRGRARRRRWPGRARRRSLDRARRRAGRLDGDDVSEAIREP